MGHRVTWCQGNDALDTPTPSPQSPGVPSPQSPGVPFTTSEASTHPDTVSLANTHPSPFVAGHVDVAALEGQDLPFLRDEPVPPDAAVIDPEQVERDGRFR